MMVVQTSSESAQIIDEDWARRWRDLVAEFVDVRVEHSYEFLRPRYVYGNRAVLQRDQ